jgi:hypothetical protein
VVRDIVTHWPGFDVWSYIDMLPTRENRIISTLLSLAAVGAVAATQVSAFSAAAETKPLANAQGSNGSAPLSPLESFRL